jgi:hypothetical protein
VVLAPDIREVRRQTATTWVEAPKACGERPLLDDRSHLAFC